MTRLSLVVLLLAAVLAGCGGDDNTSDTTTTTSAGPSTTEAITTTSSTTTTIAEVAAGACGGDGGPGDVPANAQNVSNAIVDADGDGLDDIVKVYATGNPEPWIFHIAWGAGATGSALIEPAGPGSAVEVLGGHDVDDDGDDEVFVRVGQGASAAIVGLMTVIQCTPERVMLGGGPATFAVGASAGNQSGLMCLDERLVVLEGQTADTQTYDWTEVQYSLSGTALSVAENSAGTYQRPEDDGEIASLGNLDCQGTAL